MSRKVKRNVGVSIKTRLLQFSKDSQLDYMKILVRYLHERLLYRVSISAYREKLLLKGSSLLYAHERWAARPTLDIDLLGYGINNSEDNIRSIMTDICQLECPDDGVTFDAESIHLEPIAVEKKYPGVCVTVEAHLDSIKQAVSVDIGFGDVITPQPVPLDYPTILKDIPEANLMAYSLETLIAEKFHAMVDRDEQNSRMKDFYDVYQLFLKNAVNTELLKEAIVNTFRNRGMCYHEHLHLFDEQFATNPDRNKRWKAFLRKMKIPDTIEFENVMQVIKDNLQRYWKAELLTAEDHPQRDVVH